MGLLLNDGSKRLAVRWLKLFIVSTAVIALVWIAFANHILGEADIIKAVVESALIGVAIATAQLVLDPRPHAAVPQPPSYMGRPPAPMSSTPASKAAKKKARKK